MDRPEIFSLLEDEVVKGLLDEARYTERLISCRLIVGIDLTRE